MQSRPPQVRLRGLFMKRRPGQPARRECAVGAHPRIPPMDVPSPVIDEASLLRRQLVLFLCTALCLAMANGVYEPVFNNFLKDTFALDAQTRGQLEFPRELPGLMVVVMTGVLCMLTVTRVGMTGALVYAAGLAGLSLFGGVYGVMVLLMVLASTGQHLIMPVSGSIAVGLSTSGNRGKRLGQLEMVNTFGMILGSGSMWFLLAKTNPQYRMAFAGAAGLALMGALLYGRLHFPEMHQRRGRFVYRRKFSLYYMLEFLHGARKQIFLTFGPWVLIQVYGMEARDIAGLVMTASIIGLVFKPVAGHLIDRLGERLVLVADGLMLFVVCMGYGFAGYLMGSPEKALPLAAACYVGDHLLFALGMGRVVYMSRVADSPSEVTSTLAMGTSINHIASMLIPMAAGLIWVSMGYHQVFLGAAVLALMISVLSGAIPGRATHEVGTAA
jgi:MFS family permease